MKRRLRSTASKSDAENELHQAKSTEKSVVTSRSQRNRKNTILNENKENVATRRTKHNTQKQDAVVQPLQEHNSIAIDQKRNDKAQAIESSKVESVATNGSSNQTRSRRKLVNDEKHTEEIIVAERQSSKQDDQSNPSTTTTTKKPAVASSVTTRKRKPSKDSDSKLPDTTSQYERGTPPETSEAIESSSKRARPDPEERKTSSGMDTKTKKSVVEFSCRTRSGTKAAEKVNPVRGKRRRQVDKPTKTTADKPAVVSKPTKRNAAIKPPLVDSNVTVTRGGGSKSKAADKQASSTEGKKNSTNSAKVSIATDKQSSTQPKSADNSQFFITRRRNQKNFEQTKTKSANNDDDDNKPTSSANDDKSATKHKPVISNVTTRRRGTTKAGNDPSEIIPRAKRSQSVNRVATKGKETEKILNSNDVAVGDIPRTKRSQTVSRVVTSGRATRTATSSAVKKQKTPTIASEPQTTIENGQSTKQKPELLNNRSIEASDSSDQSHGSAVPIYKRDSNTNNNTVNSVFDFESNSQENTLNTDQQMQDTIAKLVREKKASVVKRKPRAKKGDNTKKANVTRSKQIEKLRSDLKQLKELKIPSSTKTTVSANVTTRNLIPKPNVRKPNTEKSIVKTTPDNVDVMVDLVNDSVRESPSNDFAVEPLQSPAIENFTDDVLAIDHVEDTRIVRERPVNQEKLASTSQQTTSPLRHNHSTYTGPKKVDALYQSTPVRIANAGNASPWRINPAEITYPNNVFSRYSELEKSPIKSDVTKLVVETKSPSKKPPRPSTKQISNILPQIEKPKTLQNDLRNGFGFLDDEDIDDDDNNVNECYTQRPSLPPLHTSITPMNPTQKPTRKIHSPKKPTTVVSSSPSKTLKSATTTKTIQTSSFFKMPKVFNTLREKVNRLKNISVASSSDVLSETKSKTQSKISSHFGDSMNSRSAFKPSSSSSTNKLIVNKNKIEMPRTKEISETETTTTTTTSCHDTDNLSLFDSTWLDREEKPHRSYSRVTKREPKRQYDHSHLPTDDESEMGDTVVQKRTKRTKPKDDKHQEELKRFEEKCNSEFMEVEDFELIMEKSA